jgi:4-amino-4-deoxy-L-arabinose transferase-like glycosyltransferase
MKKKTKFSEPIIIGLLFSLISFLLRFIYLIILQSNLNDFVKWMPQEHHQRAIKLLSEGQVFYANAWGSFYLFLAGLYAMFDFLNLKNQLYALVISNIILTSIAVYIFFLLAVKLFNQTQAVISTLLLIIYFPLIYFNGLIANENIFLLLLIGGMYYLYLSTKSTKLKPFLIAGLLIGLATSIRSILTPFIPLACLWLVKTNSKKILKGLLIFILGLVIPIIIFLSLNYRFSKQHQFQLSGSTGINFAITQCHYKKVTYLTDSGETFWFSPPNHHSTSLKELTTTIPFYQQPHYFKLGFNCLINHPANLYQNSQNIFNLFDSVLYPDFNMSPFKNQLYNFSKNIVVISFILFLLYPLTTKPKSFYWLCSLLILSLFTSIYLANPGEERYLVPFAWVFFLFAPQAILNLKEKLTKRT